jgi:hypothetical protein
MDDQSIQFVNVAWDGTNAPLQVTTIPYFAPMSPFIAKSNLKIHFTTHGSC